MAREQQGVRPHATCHREIARGLPLAGEEQRLEFTRARIRRRTPSRRRRPSSRERRWRRVGVEPTQRIEELRRARVGCTSIEHAIELDEQREEFPQQGVLLRSGGLVRCLHL